MRHFIVCPDCGQLISYKTDIYPYLFENEKEWILFKNLKKDADIASYFSNKFMRIKLEKDYKTILPNLFRCSCKNCGCSMISDYVPLAAVNQDVWNQETIDSLMSDPDLMKMYLPFGTVRFIQYIQLGYVYKKVGLKASAKVILEEALKMEEDIKPHKVRTDGKTNRSISVNRIQEMLSSLN